jgi:hypothetical protein
VSLSVLLYLLWLLALIWILFHPSLRKKDENLDADQFERKLRIAKRIYRRRDVPWSDVERLLRRRRELGRLENRTSAEAVELKEISLKQNWSKVLLSPIYAVLYKLRPRRSYIFALCALIILITGALTYIAHYQAEQVREGNVFFGHQVGLFGYHAEEVGIIPTSAKPTKSVQTLQRSREIFLGENAQYAVFYLPGPQVTVRVPTDSIIIYDHPQ